MATLRKSFHWLLRAGTQAGALGCAFCGNLFFDGSPLPPPPLPDAPPPHFSELVLFLLAFLVGFSAIGLLHHWLIERADRERDEGVKRTLAAIDEENTQRLIDAAGRKPWQVKE